MKTTFAAIYTRFLADTNLVGSVTGLYNTKAPSNAVFPYIVFSLTSNTEDFDSSNFYEDAVIQFSIFSDAKSPEEVCDIYEYLTGDRDDDTSGFDFHTLLVDNYTTLAMMRNTSNLIQVDKVWQYTVNYELLMNYTGEGAAAEFISQFYALMGMSI